MIIKFIFLSLFICFGVKSFGQNNIGFIAKREVSNIEGFRYIPKNTILKLSYKEQKKYKKELVKKYKIIYKINDFNGFKIDSFLCFEMTFIDSFNSVKKIYFIKLKNKILQTHYFSSFKNENKIKVVINKKEIRIFKRIIFENSTRKRRVLAINIILNNGTFTITETVCSGSSTWLKEN